jgi:S-adenosylmethionine hydrolase
MLPISILTDYGYDDEFVGVLHGVIARIAPDVRVIDVTHGTPRGDIRAGALALLRAVQYLPTGVALAVVDPGVGTARRAIAVRCEWGMFVGPDNGLLAPAVAIVGGADLVVSIEDPRFRLPAHGATFAGRDVFAPAAAVLASGEADITDLGPAVAGESVTPLLLPLVEIDAGSVRGEVLWVDHFGNVETNVTPQDMAGAGAAVGDDVVMVVGAFEQQLTWVAAYGDVTPGSGLVHVDSYGQVAVAVREGRADETYPLGPGVAVTFRAIGATPIRVQGVDPAE